MLVVSDSNGVSMMLWHQFDDILFFCSYVSVNMEFFVVISAIYMLLSWIHLIFTVLGYICLIACK